MTSVGGNFCYYRVMKKSFLITYLLFSISILLTAASWFTWGSSCQDIYRLVREADSFGGMCACDGVQFVGVFVFFLVITAIYLVITALVLKLLGIKLTK